jgi:hypothetical protein
MTALDGVGAFALGAVTSDANGGAVSAGVARYARDSDYPTAR